MKKTIQLLQSKWREYLIELIVIIAGILLALALNNWNEDRKDRVVEKNYLKGIQADFKKDTAFIHLLIPNYERRLNLYKIIDTSFFLPPEFQKPIHELLQNKTSYLPEKNQNPLSKTNIKLSDFAFLSRPFRPTTGTYKALLSEGKSSLIRNRKLFSQIQNVYEIENVSALNITQFIQEIVLKVIWENRVVIDKDPCINDINDPVLLSELSMINTDYRLYFAFMKSIEKDIVQVIEELEIELQKF